MAVSIQVILFSISLIFLFTLVTTPFFFFEPKTIPISKSPSGVLHGNFLHITDFHPDPHYVSNVTARSRCHGRFQQAKRPKHMKKGISGPWGAPATVCDSPLGLIDATFEWLEKTWKDKIDFIIWTGDNVRHDSDEDIPRTPEEIFELNRMIAEKFLKTFSNTKKKRGPYLIPIIPSIGNNDIYPNNVILPGPNHLLRVLYEIWSPFIPKGQHKNFIHGGYYYNEVIPKKLMVVSLNTLYFYKANTAVNGCKAHNQPGTIELKWLDDLLKKARKNGMKVYLTGHVGPRPNQYMKSCYKRYGRLSLKYHDVILGHFYGHSNMDHFFFIGQKELRGRRRRRRRAANSTIDDEIIMDEEGIYDDDDENDYDYDDDVDDYDYDDDDEDEDEDEDEDDYEDDEVHEGDEDYKDDQDYEDDEADQDDELDVDDEDDESLKIENKNDQVHFEVDSPQDENDENDEKDGKVETNVYNIERYMNKLLRHYNKVSRSKSKEYAVININPSIIPTFFPALRIFKYNTTEVTRKDTIDDEVDLTRKRKRKVRRHPNAPSHVNTFLTPLGYTQYFMNLTHANFYPNVTPEYIIEYTTRNDYRMKDLTVPSWVQLARKIVSRGFRSSLWKKIQGNMMVGTRSLVRQKRKRSYKYSEGHVKGPEDYISEIDY